MSGDLLAGDQIAFVGHCLGDILEWNAYWSWQA